MLSDVFAYAGLMATLAAAIISRRHGPPIYPGRSYQNISRSDAEKAARRAKMATDRWYRTAAYWLSLGAIAFQNLAILFDR